MRIRAFLVSLVVATLIVLPAYAVYATDVPEATTTTPAQEGPGPAEEAEAPAEEEADAPWTERFLAPTVALLGILAVGGVVIYYFVAVRGRYQVVD